MSLFDPKFGASPSCAEDHRFIIGSAGLGEPQSDHVIVHDEPKRVQVGPTCGGNITAIGIGIVLDVAHRAAIESGDILTVGEIQSCGLFQRDISGSGLWAMGQLAYMKNTSDVVGTFLRAVFYAATRRGTPTRLQHPEEELLPPDAQALGDLVTAPIEYRRIEGRLSTFAEFAIRQDEPVLLAQLVGAAYERARDEDVIDRDGREAGHGILLDAVVYREGKRLFRSPDIWAGRDHIYYTADYVDTALEAWALRYKSPRS